MNRHLYKLVMLAAVLCHWAFAAPLTFAWDDEQTGVTYELYRGIELLGATSEKTIVAEVNAGDVLHVIALNEVGLKSMPSETLTIQPSDMPAGRYRITLYTAADSSRQHRRKEAEFYQPEEGPERFWWAEIEKEIP